MDDTGGLTCFKCFNLVLRSSNVLQVIIGKKYLFRYIYINVNSRAQTVLVRALIGAKERPH
jgi:hypothetical protein